MSKASVYMDVSDHLDKHGARQIKSALAKLPGVFSVTVSDSGRQVSVDYDTTGSTDLSICRELEKQGLSLLSHDTRLHIM